MNNMTEHNETPKVQALYDNLTPWRGDDDAAWVVNTTMGLRYLAVAEATEGGDAGGARMTNCRPVRLYPGLNAVSSGYVARVEADASRQRERFKGGGILSQTLAAGTVIIVKDLGKTSADKVSEWLRGSANLEVIHSLRNDEKHGAAARQAWDAWHDDEEASDHVKTLRHFWAMAEGSRKVA